MVRKPSKKPSLEWNHINEIIMQENAVNERHLSSQKITNHEAVEFNAYYRGILDQYIQFISGSFLRITKLI